MDQRPIDRAATLALARRARRLLVKSGTSVASVDGPFTDDELARHLVHADGFLRVPVLVIGETIVRGYTEALYREAFDA